MAKLNKHEMKTNQILNKVRELLGMEVKLEQMLMADGVTKVEADAFEADNNVVVVTEDEQKIPVPVGEYEMQDGRIMVVVEEGVISEMKQVKEEEEMPEAPAQEPAEVEQEMSNEPAQTIKKTVESIVKETFFTEMEELKKENEELKAKLETLSKVENVEKDEAIEVELSETEPIVFNPENTQKVEHFKFATKKGKTTMDTILNKLNK
jgi:predicted ribosome-associated RNA-binding protein Tma20